MQTLVPTPEELLLGGVRSCHMVKGERSILWCRMQGDLL